MTESSAIAGYLENLVAGGFEVTVSTRKSPDSDGYFVSLEHMALQEPEEFYGPTIRAALYRARSWVNALNPATWPGVVKGAAE